MWLFLSIALIFGMIIYVFVPNFRQSLNNYITGFGYWLAATFHISTWTINILRWVGNTFRRGLLALLALVIAMGFIWEYAYIHQSPDVLLYALIGTAILLTILIVIAQAITGVGEWFGLSGNAGPATKFGITFLLWILIQFGLLSIPGGWYMSHLTMVVFGTLILLAFMFKGWYNNKPSKIAAGFLVTLFIGSLIYSVYKNYEAGYVTLPRWAQNTIEAYETRINAYSIRKKTDGQILLASFCTPSIAYTYDKSQNKFTALPSNKYQPGDIVTVAKKEIDPTLSHGESMLEIVTQNKYGDMFGTNAWVPARKLEYLSASELREQQKKAIEKAAKDPVYQLLKIVGGHNRKWEVPNPFMEYYFEVPAGTYVIFDDSKASGRGKAFDNSNNT